MNAQIISEIHLLANKFMCKHVLDGQDMRKMFCLADKAHLADFDNQELLKTIRTVTENGYKSGKYMAGWTSTYWTALSGAMHDVNPNKIGYCGDGKDLVSYICICYSPDEGATNYIFGTTYEGYGPDPSVKYAMINDYFVSGSTTQNCIGYVKM